MARINIVTNLENKWGLYRDKTIITSVLQAHGHEVYETHWKKPPNRHKRADYNIHLEVVGTRHLKGPHKNILIPNAEWFFASWRNPRNLVYKVLVKTNHAVPIFEEIGFPTVEYTGFTGIDQFDPHIERVNEFVHIAGNSAFKGTLAILKAWQKNPQWPTLHIFVNNPKFQPDKTPNIKITNTYVTDEEIKVAQNKYRFSIQPSEAEGFGHCIVEPLSCNNVVLTVDAPPMNEFPVITCGYSRKESHWYDYRHFVNSNHVETLVERALRLTKKEIRNLQNRKWYLENHNRFIERFLSALELT